MKSVLEHYKENYFEGREKKFPYNVSVFLRKIFGSTNLRTDRTDAFNEIRVLNPRPDSSGIVSYSLWGDGTSSRFRKGLMEPLLQNAKQLNSKLPNWVGRIYASEELPEHIMEELVDAGYEIYVMPSPRHDDGYVWRFLAAKERKPVIIHDADMVFDYIHMQPGLFEVIEKWLETDKPFLRRTVHLNRAWYPLSAGAWGVRPLKDGESPLVNIKDQICKYSFEGFGADEAFLTKEVWPVMKREGYYTTPLNPRTIRSLVITGVSVLLFVLLIVGGVWLFRRKKGEYLQ